MIISLITLFLFLKLCAFTQFSLIYPSIILFFYPYFLKPSFAFFMSIYGLMFFLLFLLFIDRENNYYIFISGLSLAAAILSQQFYLILFLFYTFYIIYKEYELKISLSFLLKILLFLIPFVLPGILFIFWQGIVHPSYTSWGVSLNLSTGTAVFITLGAVFMPYTVFNLENIKIRQLLLIIFISIFLTIFAYPVWVNQPTQGGISGLTFNFLDNFSVYSSFISFILKTVFAVLGISTFILFYNSTANGKLKLYFFIYLVLGLGFAINKLPSERHMLPLIVIGILLIVQIVKKEYILKLWLIYQIIIGGVYFYYIMYVY